MALGKLFHYALDAALLSTVLAGVKKSSGFSPDLAQISNPTARSLAETYLGFGESVFGIVQGSVVNSAYFTHGNGSAGR
ncbi:DUF1748-domain-containing protein [Gymnopus androsaceus JB14]|uniref:DUF1748-domain-containing protein n=1 Tax=Gymnopus androsaceus JB14 TaxID=1447944 RepID=A0A6A4GXP7_9AGAR|nr:DUF1748-domain-containing protein [Gymnopus androsaceus JB14]